MMIAMTLTRLPSLLQGSIMKVKELSLRRLIRMRLLSETKILRRKKIREVSTTEKPRFMKRPRAKRMTKYTEE